MNLPTGKSESQLGRVLGYQPIPISSGLKHAIWSAIISIPVALTATGISDSTAVSDGFRYVFSPGTMLALRLVKPESSHRGLGAFLDAVGAYSRMMSFALLLNAVFYALLVFGALTAISGAKADSVQKSQ